MMELSYVNYDYILWTFTLDNTKTISLEWCDHVMSMFQNTLCKSKRKYGSE